MKSIISSKRIYTEVVFGLLGSGKTNYINRYSEKMTEEQKRKTGVIQFENGIEKIKELKSLLIKNLDDDYIADKIDSFIKENRLNKLIIEWNGMRLSSELYMILDKLDNIYFTGSKTVLKTSTFEMYLKNFRELLTDPISQSELILLDNNDDEVEKNLMNINGRANIYSVNEFLERHSKKSIRNLGSSFLKILILLATIFFSYNIFFRSGIIAAEDIDKIRGVFVISFGIILEAVPFILVGVIISSLIQIILTEDRMEKVIPKNKIIGILSALMLGFIFPVCDCATVPIAVRMIRKRVPIYFAIIFMLSSPIINPTVLLATYYAFRNIFPELIYIRFLLGIMVAVIIGIAMHIIYKDREILIDGNSKIGKEYGCSCEYCVGYQKRAGVDTFLRQIIDEFISVGKYLIMGSIIAAVFQIVLPIEIVYKFSENNLVSIVIMVLFSYIISLCSTSDSFIARAFFLRMSTSSIIGFLISGPMIDVKNTIILLGIFKKNFVITLVTIILCLTIVSSALVGKFLTLY